MKGEGAEVWAKPVRKRKVGGGIELQSKEAAFIGEV